MAHTKIKHIIRLPRILALSALLMLIILSVQHPLQAQVATQGYASDQKLQRGMLVRLKQNDATKIEAASQNDGERIDGVVVDPNDSPVTLSTDGQKVFVATTGKFEVLVSTQNGPVSAGDFITISAVDGVGMKAGTTEPVVVGKAIGTFDGKSNAISSQSVKDSTGADSEVIIGRVSMELGIARNPLLKSVEPNMPAFLKKASESIAGKAVNPMRVYIAVVVLLAASILAASLLIGGVRSALISIGRNPLGKKAIVRGMFQVIIVGITVFILGLFGVYLLLKL